MLATVKPQGFILPGVLALVVIAESAYFLLGARISSQFNHALSANIHESRRDWAMSVATRMDCNRTVGNLAGPNPCPLGAARTLVFVGMPPESPQADGSFALGKGWSAQVRCGQRDLSIRIARRVGGDFVRDPVTRVPLDFNHPASEVSDRTGGVPFCPGAFGSGASPIQQITMSIWTHQELGNLSDANGKMITNNPACDGTLQGASEVDNSPLPARFRAEGRGPNTPTPVAAASRAWLQAWAGALGHGRDLRPLDIYTLQWNRPLASVYCNKICVDRSFDMGITAKCDPTIPAATVPRGVVIPNSDIGQVTCVCFR